MDAVVARHGKGASILDRVGPGILITGYELDVTAGVGQGILQMGLQRGESRPGVRPYLIGTKRLLGDKQRGIAIGLIGERAVPL